MISWSSWRAALRAAIGGCAGRRQRRVVPGFAFPDEIWYLTAQEIAERERRMSSRRVAVAADHAGFELKAALVKILRDDLGCEAIDLGTTSSESVDYPDYAGRVVEAIRGGGADRGVLVCGSGIGMSIAANRHTGIRAALCATAETARLARQHNDANVLVLGSRTTDAATAAECLRAFLATAFEGGRHARRVAKLA
ncbi:MAG: ribose 5-phosphate isomerase B [Rhodospirillales bacterium]